jgi:hypothetical protein
VSRPTQTWLSVGRLPQRRRTVLPDFSRGGGEAIVVPLVDGLSGVAECEPELPKMYGGPDYLIGQKS